MSPGQYCRYGSPGNPCIGMGTLDLEADRHTPVLISAPGDSALNGFPHPQTFHDTVAVDVHVVNPRNTMEPDPMLVASMPCWSHQHQQRRQYSRSANLGGFAASSRARQHLAAGERSREERRESELMCRDMVMTCFHPSHFIVL